MGALLASGAPDYNVKMSKFTPRQKSIFTGVAIVEFIVGIALMVVSLTGISSIPIFIPLLLIVSAMGLLIAARRG